MIIYAQPGYAIDWDWRTELTVWSTRPDRADRLVARHRLDRAPHSEAEAAAVARRWWHHEGRTRVHPEDQPQQTAARAEEAR